MEPNAEFEEEFYAFARAGYEAHQRVLDTLCEGEAGDGAKTLQITDFSALRTGEKIAWNAAAIAIIEKKLGVGQEAEIVRLNYEQGGTLDMSLRHPVVFAMTKSMVEFFDDNKGDNYVETTVTAPERGQFVMTVQRKAGKTPHEFRRAAEDKLKSVAALMHGDMNDHDKITAVLHLLEGTA
jgi:hypothetical protein